MDIIEEEFCKLVGRAYFEKCRDGDDGKEYVVDSEKAKNVLRILDYCDAFAKRNGGKIECLVIKKRDEPVAIEMRFVDDLTIGDEENAKDEFLSVLANCKALTLSGTGLEDGSFLMSLFMDNPYQPK